ncbi:MAG: SirB2 family protein [Burkholderiales bacterium]|nr:SirB2 family protein [Burkholderiales bacterium]MDE2160370.1 SirB2 family protein [Burkholderiales bacterium]MDE2504679.1 SirB2 family protein [Burkholderiales bacterium]
MDYAVVKAVHLGAVAVSGVGFVARAAGALAGARWVRSRWARTLPHGVDTVLLLSALTLAWMLRLSPLATPWLMAKIVGLLAYIGFGVVALRPGTRFGPRAASAVAAVLVFAWIASVAVSKNPLGWFAPH